MQELEIQSGGAVAGKKFKRIFTKGETLVFSGGTFLIIATTEARLIPCFCAQSMHEEWPLGSKSGGCGHGGRRGDLYTWGYTGYAPSHASYMIWRTTG